MLFFACVQGECAEEEISPQVDIQEIESKDKTFVILSSFGNNSYDAQKAGYALSNQLGAQIGLIFNAGQGLILDMITRSRELSGGKTLAVKLTQECLEKAQTNSRIILRSRGEGSLAARIALNEFAIVRPDIVQKTTLYVHGDPVVFDLTAADEVKVCFPQWKIADWNNAIEGLQKSDEAVIDNSWSGLPSSSHGLFSNTNKVETAIFCKEVTNKWDL